jgi:DNA-binding SARP family transcriptional activator
MGMILGALDELVMAESRRRSAAVRLPAPAPWQLRLMGGLAVAHGDQRWDRAQVGSRRARILLALLAVENGRLTPVERIVEMLWPAQPPRRPVANVATLVSRLRAKFGADLIVGGGFGYRIGDQVGTDLIVARELVVSADACLASRAHPAAREASQQALDLLRDEVLPELRDETWVVAVRAQRRSLLQRARHASAESALQTGDPWAAITVAETAIAAEPYDETACRTLMLAFKTVGEPAKALLAYDRLRRELVRDLGVDPAPLTRATYLSILRD